MTMKFEITYYTQGNKQKSVIVEVETEADVNAEINKLADDPNDPLAQVIRVTKVLQAQA